MGQRRKTSICILNRGKRKWQSLQSILTITLNNLSIDEDKELEVLLTGKNNYELVEANVLTSDDIHTYNTFDEPEKLKEEAFKNVNISGNTMKVVLPASSVVEIRVK